MASHLSKTRAMESLPDDENPAPSCGRTAPPQELPTAPSGRGGGRETRTVRRETFKTNENKHVRPVMAYA